MSRARQRRARCLIVCLVLGLAVLLTACVSRGAIADPSTWGYGVQVTYHAMGGTLNGREIRQTFYAEGSYLFQPSGSSGFLITPRREGYILAGWYTGYTAQTNEDGTTQLVFAPEDRWDFYFDRIGSEDMTLYAYWLPKAMVNYIRVFPDGTREEYFSKAITPESGVIELEPILESKVGFSVLGYYDDTELSQLHDFSSVTARKDLLPSEQELFDALYGMFPGALIPISAEETAAAAKTLEEIEPGQEENADEASGGNRDPYLFIEQYGYRLAGETPEERAEAAIPLIAARKQMIGEAIAAYASISQDTTLYMRYIEGNFRRIRSIKDLLANETDKKISLSATSYDGYIFARDIDFTGYEIVPSAFTGTIYGNGFTLSGIDVTVKGGKTVTDDEFADVGLWKSFKGVKIYDLNFKGCTLSVSEASQSSMYVGFLAGSAEDSEIVNCGFEDILIRTGAAGSMALNLKGTRVAVFGDLFGRQADTVVKHCRFENCMLEISGAVRVTPGNGFGGYTAEEPDDEGEDAAP